MVWEWFHVALTTSPVPQSCWRTWGPAGENPALAHHPFAMPEGLVLLGCPPVWLLLVPCLQIS